jgi:hypothetical protein
VSFTELVKLLRDFKRELEEAKKVYDTELRTILPTLLAIEKELKRLNNNMEKLIALSEVADTSRRLRI